MEHNFLRRAYTIKCNSSFATHLGLYKTLCTASMAFFEFCEEIASVVLECPFCVNPKLGCSSYSPSKASQFSICHWLCRNWPYLLCQGPLNLYLSRSRICKHALIIYNILTPLPRILVARMEVEANKMDSLLVNICINFLLDNCIHSYSLLFPSWPWTSLIFIVATS